MSAELIHQMYIAYYQRPADPAGLIYWQNQLNANGGGEAGWSAVSAAFANAAESSALYGNQTLGQKISAIYLAAFERAASAEEVAFWEASGFNAARIGFAIVNGAQNDDLSTVSKKVDYSEAFVSAIDPAGTGVGPFEFQYVDPALGRQLMDPITKDSDVSSATVASQVSSTLPTLNTVNLTSGNDVVTPQANAAEEINAALGGSSPSLGRADQIDGGSAQDTINVDMDGNFLLGFGSGGFMKDVEIVNLSATAPSVTPKQFNFTGVSGVETINVGASNAAIGISEISDVGITVNLSGLGTGLFDVGYATGAISGSGSAMTIGVTDVGTSNADSVALTANGITELNLVSYGAQNYVALGNSVNDIVALNISGTGGLDLTSIPSSVSGLDATSLGGALSVEFNVDDNAALAGASGVIAGGAGTDTLVLNGSGIAAFTGSSIEELKWDGASGEALVNATAITSLTTVTFSGDAVKTPIIRGLETISNDITINATYSSSSPDTYAITAATATTVNLKADATSISSQQQADNDFTLTSNNGAAISVNVEEYVSSAGTLRLEKASSFDVTVDSTSDFGNQVKLSAASTVNVSGAGAISATISGEKVTTVNVDVASGSFNFGGSAIQTLTLSSDDGLTLMGSSNVTGTVNLSVNAGGSVELANATFRSLETLTGSGGASASLGLGNMDLISGNIAMSLTGFGRGVSAANIEMTSANVTLDGSGVTGGIDVLKISGTEAVTISTGTDGGFSAGEIHGQDSVVIDMTAKSSGSTGDLIVNTLSGSGAITVSLGAHSAGQSGLVAISALAAGSNFVLDGTNYGGDIDLAGGAGFSVGGAMTISLGGNASLSGENAINVKGNVVIDASNATSAGIGIHTGLSGAAVTMSLGTGSTAAFVSATRVDGNTITLDGSNFGGDIDITTLSSSGNMTFALGSGAEFSANAVSLAGGNFVLDAANATTAEVTLTDISGSGSVTLSLGGGSGTVSAGVVGAGKNFTMDGSTSGAKYDFHSISGSGTVTVSLGADAAFSGSAITNVGGNVTFDASGATSADITLQHVSAIGNLTFSLGGGTGDLTLVSAQSNKNFVFDASNNSGQATLNGGISASGTVTMALSKIGDLSMSAVNAGGNISIDASTANSATISIGTYSGQASFTLSVGGGSGSVTLGDDGNETKVAKNFTLDAGNYGGDVSIQAVTGSGAATISMGGPGTFSAGNIVSASSAVFDFSGMNSAGSVNIGKVSADSLTITLGTNSARFSAHTLSIVESTNSNNNIVVDGSNYLGVQHFDIVSASGNFTVTAGGPGDVEISAANVGGNLTLDMSTSTSGKAVLSSHVSVSGTTTITLGTQSGGSAATFSALNGVGAITVTGAAFNNDMSFKSVSGQSNVTITSGGSGTVSGSAFDAAGNFTLSAYLGGGEALTLSDISASGNISVTVTGGSGVASISSINTLGGTFTFDTNASTQTNGAHTIQTVSATAAAVVMGTGDNLNISAMAIGAGGMSVTTDASSDITLTLISSNGAVTLNQVGGGDFTVGSADLNGAGAFTYNATGLASGGSLQINSAQISANVVLNYGTDGLVANVSAQDIGTVGSFTLNGSQLSTANIVVGRLSAEGAISIDVGAASGSLNLSAINTSSSFTLDAGAASNLDIDVIENIQASADITVTLGALSAAAHNVQVSSAGTKGALTIDASAFREELGFVSASAASMTVTLGDLVDNFSANEINTTGEFNLTVGGNNGSISAHITAGDFGSSFTITMADIGNGGLALGQGGAETMTFSASGMIVGTMAGDSASVTSTSGAGELQKLEFYMGESDADEDDLKVIGGAGKTVVTVRHFESGTDEIHQNDQSSNLTQLTFTTAQAASLIADALELSSDPSESDVQNVVAARTDVGSAVWTYNNDAYYIGGDADKDGVLDNGEVIFRFVEVTNFGADAGDFTAIS